MGHYARSPRQILLSALCLAGCHGGQRPAPEAEQPPVAAHRASTSPLVATRLYASDHSPQAESSRLVVRDSATFASTWSQLTQSETPAPSVDFSHDIVLVAAMGTQRTGGYAIGIDTVTLGNDSLVAIVRLHQPGAGCMLAQMLTDPVAIVRVAGANHPVRFVDEVVHAPAGRC